MAVLAFDPSAAGTGIAFAHGNLKARSTTASWATARTTQALPSGKYYIEFLVLEISSSGVMMGLTNASGPLNNFLGSDSNSVGWHSTHGPYGAVGGGIQFFFARGDTIGMAIDVTNKRAWFRRNGGSWIGGGDPAAGTSPQTWSFSGDVFVAVGVINNRSAIAVNSGAGPFRTAAPSGFSAIGTAYSWPIGLPIFDAATKPANATLSGDNKTATSTSSDVTWKMVRGVAPGSGKHYIEYQVTDPSSFNIVVGLCCPLINDTYGPGVEPNWVSANLTAGWQHNFYWDAAFLPRITIASGNVIGVAWDMDVRRAWIRKADGSWSTGDPVAGTGGGDISSLLHFGAGVTPYVALYNSGSAVSIVNSPPYTYGSPFPARRTAGRVIWIR